jgi:hypothetical protein
MRTSVPSFTILTINNLPSRAVFLVKLRINQKKFIEDYLFGIVDENLQRYTAQKIKSLKVKTGLIVKSSIAFPS